MSIRLKLKNSVVQDSTPSTSDLPEVGELAVNGNINSIGGFMRASNNTIVKIFGPGSVTTPTATTTVSGISELATNSETTTGTATNRVVTPAGLNAVTVAERTTSNTNYVAKAGSTMTGVLTATAGSNSAPAINFGDSDSGIFGGTNTVSLAAGGTTRLTADTGVSVVGTLAVTGAISSTAAITGQDFRSDTSATFFLTSGLDWRFRSTSGSEKLRITNVGRVLFGTSVERSPAAINARLQIEGTTADMSSMSLTRNSADTSSARFIFNKSRGTSIGSDVVVQNGDGLGLIDFVGNDGTDSDSVAARIGAFVDAVPGSNDMPGRLFFGTTSDGGTSPETRLIIDSGGHVRVPDDVKFVAGTGLDLKIYHDGTNSIIQNLTGNLQVIESGQFRGRANAYVFNNFNDQEGIIKGFADGAVELYYDGNKKLESTSTGIAITGGFTTSGGSAFNSTISFNDDASFFGASYHVFFDRSENAFEFQDNAKATFGTGNDLSLFHDGGNAHFQNTTGTFKIKGDDTHLQNASGSEEYITAQANGAVHLFYDNSSKLETNSSGVHVSGSASIGNDLTINTGNQAQVLRDWSNTTDSDISGLLSGSTFGTLLEAAPNGHHVIALRENDANDSFSIVSGGGNFQTDDTYDTLVCRFFANGVINIPDTGVLKIGDGNDLQIYHDGSNSFINNFTGNLQLRPKTGEAGLQLVPNGTSQLYFDGSSKFETTSNGAKCTGILESANQGNILNQTNSALILKSSTNDAMRANFLLQDDFPSGSGSLAINVTEAGVSNDRPLMLNRSGGFVGVRCTPTVAFEVSGDSKFLNNVAHVDNAKAQFGNSNDLQIYHDGSESVIGNSTGTLQILSPVQMRLRATNFVFAAYDNSETMAKFTDDGAVELYFDNSKKLKTISEGVKLTELQIAPSGTETSALVNFAGGGCSTNADSYSYFLERATAGTNTNAFTFRSGPSQTHVGTINFNNTSTMYNTSSDYRLKENAVSISDGITRLKTLKPYRFNFKGETDIVDGFFAHEVTPAVPEAISGTKDEVDSKGNPVLQGIDQSKLVPLLVAAVQELIGRVEKLEAA